MALTRGVSRLPGSRRLGLAYAWTLPLASVSGFVVPALQPVLAAIAAAVAGVAVARWRSPVRERRAAADSVDTIPSTMEAGR